jgi:hypothetical protein
VRNTGEMFEFINDIKEKFKYINSFIPIYSDIGAGTGNIKFLKKYEVPAECAGRKAVTDIKNLARS